LEQLRTGFEEVRLLKESFRGSVRLILRWFTGNGEACQRLLNRSGPYPPLIHEVAERDGENIALAVQGCAALDGGDLR